jgi:hypothetical protein
MRKKRIAWQISKKKNVLKKWEGGMRATEQAQAVDASAGDNTAGRTAS